MVYQEFQGKQRWVKGFADKRETQALANRLEDEKTKLKRGDIDAKHEQRKLERAKPIEAHLEEYKATLEAKAKPLLRTRLHADSTANENSRLEPGHRDAFNEILLRREEQDHARKHAHDGRRHQQVGVADAVLAAKGVEGQRERAVLRAVQIDQRIEEIIPRRQEGVDRDDRDHRPGERQHELPVDPPVARAVDAGGFDQLFGNLRKNCRNMKT